MLTPTMGWLWRPQGALEIMTETPLWVSVRMMPTSMLMSPTQTVTWESTTKGPALSHKLGMHCLSCSGHQGSNCKVCLQEGDGSPAVPLEQGLWSGLVTSCQVVLGNDYEAIRTEWDLTLDKDHSSFKVGRMMV